MKPVLLIVAFSAALFSLAGCAHEPTQTVADECLGYGYERGTALYLDCIQKVAQMRTDKQERSRQAWSAMAQQNQQQNQAFYQQQMNAINQNYQTYRQNRTVTTNCMPMGNSVSCTSY